MDIPVTFRCTVDGCGFSVTVPHKRGEPLWEPTDERGLYLMHWVRDAEGVEHLFCLTHSEQWETAHHIRWRA